MHFRRAVRLNSSPDWASKPAITPFGRLSSNRDRYVAGVSLSCRAGYDSDFVGVAVPGVPLRGAGGSEFCLSRCGRLKISPKLLRPLVEVEVRLDGAMKGGA